MSTFANLAITWRHRFAHALGIAKATRHHGHMGGVCYSWDECETCGALSGGLAHDEEADRWYIPGPRELRHNTQLIHEMEDP